MQEFFWQTLDEFLYLLLDGIINVVLESYIGKVVIIVATTTATTIIIGGSSDSTVRTIIGVGVVIEIIIVPRIPGWSRIVVIISITYRRLEIAVPIPTSCNPLRRINSEFRYNKI